MSGDDWGQFMSFAMLLLYVLVLYVIVGVCVGLSFVIFGVTRVLSPPMSATLGARIFILPAATALWPYVLSRWLSSGRLS
jgi:hypothetical protein